ncbi:MAG: hypothetical protein JRM76_06325 [Nitrososphaerota archaeon]|jgi:hypothetical protein|nr:hypothetical protein [Nitrososphaerota archaeon]MDG6913160.1 hypothetical protein [Nitrososphaerota archaeon]MDG6937097.1 hypothetical protein [Nitrososphaerota archaeon]MDG6971147.1 hypothetical protein [Nitrososphaerota archaeon]MDG6972339.1 hypothetical protein [Nitrososphaerota archaeon]
MEPLGQLRRPLEIAPRERPYTTIASLPKNSTSLAVRAVDGGADAIMLNIEGDDNSHPSHFGSYDLHDVYINDVISTVSVPCGIFVGGARLLTEEYWERIMSSNFSFVEMYAHQMPTFVLSDSRVKKISAVSTGYILEQVKQLSAMDGIEAIDMATVPHQMLGAPFSVLDYATLGVVTGLAVKPVLLRTQKRLARTDIDRVVALGVRGLVVDPCILSGADEAYKDEIASLAPRGVLAEGQ